MRRSVRLVGTLSSLVLACVVLRADQDLTRKDADSMEHKLSTIIERGDKPVRAGGAPIRTSFTEREVNAYLKFNQALMPKGLVNPRVTIPGDHRLEGRAIVDLDAVRTSKERTWLDPANLFLRGSVEVHAAGTLAASNGKGLFQLESASVGAVPIPKSLLQELVTYYSRTSEAPNGVDLDKPFDLPAKIREVLIQRGAATIVQ